MRKDEIRKRYVEDHVFRSLVDVIASHFRLNLRYTKQEVLDAVAVAEIVVRERGKVKEQRKVAV